MEHDKLRILRKALTIVCFVLFFTTAGLIMIKSQIKTVVLDYYGYVQEINTLSANVENIFIENKIAFNLDDHVEPSMTSSIENGTVIKISSNVEMAKIDTDKIINEYSPSIAKLEEVVEDIPFQEENVDNANLEKGKTNIIQEGKLGKKSIKYIVRYENNKEIKRDEIGTNIIEQAENKVVEVGTKVVLASRSKEVQAMAAQSVPEGFKQYNIALPLEQQQYAYKVSQKYGIEYELFLAIMYRESSYNPNL